MPSSRIPRPRIKLRVTRPGADRTVPKQPVASWWASALSGGLLAAVAGWVLVAGLVVLGWITAMQSSLLNALRIGTQIWLLAHGAGARIGDLRITLTPLLLTAVLWLMVHGAATFAARQLHLAHGEGGLPPSRRHGAVLRVAGAVAAAYTIPVSAAAIVLAPPDQALLALLCAAVLSGTASFWGAGSGLRHRPWRRWPIWARAIAKAIGLSCLVALGGGTLALVASLAQHHARIGEISAALGAPPVGAALLVVAQALWLPTMVLWSTSFVLGGGFVLGPDALVSLSNVHVGLLPALPVLGALPSNGPGSAQMLWWLLVPVAAGAAGGWLVVRSRPRAGGDETALVGGLAGVLAALVLVALCAISRGDLGVERLVGVGPRLKELTILSCSLMGLGGLGAGLAFGLLRQRRERADASGSSR